MSIRMVNTQWTVAALLIMAGQASAVSILPEPAPLQPPAAQVTDANYVNLASGAVSPSLTTIHIGAEPMTLSHRIVSHGNYFYGYAENFFGTTSGAYLKLDSTGLSLLEVKRVMTGMFSEDFEEVNGEYVSLTNAQHTLEENASEFIYTNPEGAQYLFTKNFTEGNAESTLSEIIYPSGYTVSINEGLNGSDNKYKSVTSNAGFQLKFLYDSVSEWLSIFPKEVVAINNRYEFCPPESETCALSEDWPTTQFDWSVNVQNIIGSEIDWTFTVTDPSGREAIYFHEPHDRHEGGYYQGANRYIPRIARIEDAISQPGKRVIEYEYENIVRWASGLQSGSAEVAEIGVVKRATANGEQWSYNVANNNCAAQGCAQLNKTSGGYQAIGNVVVDAIKGVPSSIRTYDGVVTSLSRSYANYVTSTLTEEGIRTHYQYDSRGRLETIRVTATAGGDEKVTQMTYPSGCPNPKTCNKPVSVEDPEGNVTDYTYHAPSGYIASITRPPDRDGVRPQTRYTYEQKFARYHQGGGSAVVADRGIWVLTRKSACQRGPATSNGCSTAGDDVVVEYDYGDTTEPNNLFLKGKVVKADGKERRTCYQYNRLGQLVGETLPRENLSACP